eukprot:4625582-Alexandrium_andersonii.AAC.1
MCIRDRPRACSSAPSRPGSSIGPPGIAGIALGGEQMSAASLPSESLSAVIDRELRLPDLVPGKHLLPYMNDLRT